MNSDLAALHKLARRRLLKTIRRRRMSDLEIWQARQPKAAQERAKRAMQAYTEAERQVAKKRRLECQTN